MALQQHSSVRWLARVCVTLLIGLVAFVGSAQAQGVADPAEATQAGTPGIVTDPAPSDVDLGLDTSTSLTVPDHLWLRLDDAEEGSRRTRIALLAGTGAFAVGVILAAVWSGQNCTSEDKQSTCRTDAQPGLSGTTAFLVGSGSITMLTAGIMLGVRNRKKRHILDEIEQYRSPRAHWDIESGVLRF